MNKLSLDMLSNVNFPEYQDNSSKNENLNLFPKENFHKANQHILKLKNVSCKVQAIEYVKKAHLLGLRIFFPKNVNYRNFVFSGMWFDGNLDLYKRQFSLLEKAFKSWFNQGEGLLSEKYFNQYANYEWEIKENTSASMALEKILEGPSKIECILGTYIYYSYALMRMIGCKKFDQLFGSSDGTKPLIERWYMGVIMHHSFSRFIENVGLNESQKGTPNNRPLEIGDWCYFEGVAYYGLKHDNSGNGWGANVIYIGRNEKSEQLYIGFDFDTAVTEQQINQTLIDLYLLPPKEKIHPDILKITPTFSDLKGFQPTEVKRLKYDLIQEIKTHDLTPEFIKQLRSNGYLNN